MVWVLKIVFSLMHNGDQSHHFLGLQFQCALRVFLKLKRDILGHIDSPKPFICRSPDPDQHLGCTWVGRATGSTCKTLSMVGTNLVPRGAGCIRRDNNTGNLYMGMRFLDGL